MSDFATTVYINLGLSLIDNSVMEQLAGIFLWWVGDRERDACP